VEVLRRYGKSPFGVVVVHGGPGAGGEMEPVARELSLNYGVLEPLQTAGTVEGQVGELRRIIEEDAATPVTLVGWSWGAWLCYLTTARYPSRVKKLILVSSGPFEEGYAKEIMEVRLRRLPTGDRRRVETIMHKLQGKEKDEGSFKEFGALMEKADSYNLLPKTDEGKIEFSLKIYESVWREASDLRSSGELLERGRNITCVAIRHGKRWRQRRSFTGS